MTPASFLAKGKELSRANPEETAHLLQPVISTSTQPTRQVFITLPLREGGSCGRLVFPCCLLGPARTRALWFVLRKTSSSCAQRGSERMLWARRKNYLLVILSGQHKACLWRIVSHCCYLAVGSGEQSPGGRSRLFTPIAVAL